MDVKYKAYSVMKSPSQNKKQNPNPLEIMETQCGFGYKESHSLDLRHQEEPG